MARRLARDDVGLADLVCPVALLHGNDGELGQDDGPSVSMATSLEHFTP